MSDVEISGASASGSEGSTGSGAENTPAGAGGGEVAAAGSQATEGVAAKIAKHSSAKAAPAAPEAGQVQQVVQGANMPAAVQEAIDSYKANLKFKFMGQEKEIPEPFHAIIKDADSEKMVRELHERAMWFEETKPRFIEQSEKLASLNKGLQVLGNHLESGNYGKFFEAFGLTDEKIFDYARQRLEYQQMPEDQRARLDAERQIREQAEMLSQENATLREQTLEFQSQQRGQQLQSVIQHPQISPIVEKHPGGSAGFYRDVAAHAWYHEQATGVDMTPEQAVLSYIQQRGLSASQMQNATATAAAQGQAQPGLMTPQQRAPTLPTVPSQGTSPAKKMVSSMKDIHAAKARAEAQFGG